MDASDLSGPNPRVTVVIPFYNRESLLPRAVGSVEAQTFSDWEIVLVDDGSTDRSATVAQRLADRSEGRIRLARQENGGCGSARNLGNRLARGDYIALLDSDDAWDRPYLERTVAALDGCRDVDWVYTDVRRQVDGGSVLEESAFRRKGAEPFRNLATRPCGSLRIIEDPALLSVAITSTIKAGSNSVVRREVFERYRYEPEIRSCEDRVLNITAIAGGVRYGYLDEVLMTVFHHRENESVLAEEDHAAKARMLRNFIDGYRHLLTLKSLDDHHRALVRHRLSTFHFDRSRVLADARAGLAAQLGELARSVATDPIHTPLYRGLVRRLTS